MKLNLFHLKNHQTLYIFLNFWKNKLIFHEMLVMVDNRLHLWGGKWEKLSGGEGGDEIRTYSATRETQNSRNYSVNYNVWYFQYK